MTNNQKYTSGPWNRDDLLPPNGRPVIARTTGGIPISGNTDDWLGWDREDEANARLIAAAPELLEALQNLWAVCDANGCEVPRGYRNQVFAAIARATGETA